MDDRFEGPSDPFSLSIVVPESTSISNDLVLSESSDSDSESLAEVAISTYYPLEYKSQSFFIKPFLKELLRQEKNSPLHQGNHAITELKRIKSGDESPVESKYIRIHSLMLQSAHQAIESKEKQLHNRFQLLKSQEERLKKKMSKKYSILITAGVSLCTTVAGFFAAYMSK